MGIVQTCIPINYNQPKSDNSEREGVSTKETIQSISFKNLGQPIDGRFPSMALEKWDVKVLEWQNFYENSQNHTITQIQIQCAYCHMLIRNWEP